MDPYAAQGEAQVEELSSVVTAKLWGRVNFTGNGFAARLHSVHFRSNLASGTLEGSAHNFWQRPLNGASRLLPVSALAEDTHLALLILVIAELRQSKVPVNFPDPFLLRHWRAPWALTNATARQRSLMPMGNRYPSDVTPETSQGQ